MEKRHIFLMYFNAKKGIYTISQFFAISYKCLCFATLSSFRQIVRVLHYDIYADKRDKATIYLL